MASLFSLTPRKLPARIPASGQGLSRSLSFFLQLGGRCENQEALLGEEGSWSEKQSHKPAFRSPVKVIRPSSLSPGDPGAHPALLWAMTILRFIALALVTGTVGLRGTCGAPLSYSKSPPSETQVEVTVSWSELHQTW